MTAYFSNELPKSGGRSKIREQATDIRQNAILDAALKCFVDRGYLDTTIEHIRTASAASIGSIYHHFADKQVIAATLYLRTLEGAQSAALGLLHRKRTAASGISALRPLPRAGRFSIASFRSSTLVLRYSSRAVRWQTRSRLRRRASGRRRSQRAGRGWALRPAARCAESPSGRPSL